MVNRCQLASDRQLLLVGWRFVRAERTRGRYFVVPWHEGPPSVVGTLISISRAWAEQHSLVGLAKRARHEVFITEGWMSRAQLATGVQLRHPLCVPHLALPGRFHRWVRPVHLFEDVKGGHHNLQSNAIPFVQALPELMDWVLKMEESCGHPSAFVTCGNWDIKSQIPRQCKCVVRGFVHALEPLFIP